MRKNKCAFSAHQNHPSAYNLDPGSTSGSEGQGDGEVRCFCNNILEFSKKVDCEVCSGWSY